MKKRKILIFITLLAIPFLGLAGGDIPGVENPSPWGGDINTSIMTMIDGLLKLAIPFLVLAYVYVAFLFVKAQGSKDGLSEAKKAFVWLIVGTFIIVGANAIYSIVEDTLKEANIKTVYQEKDLI